MTFAIEVTQLQKTYANGKVALAGINLAVEQGSFFALLGPNGAGKSTLINILADSVRPTSGSVKFLGHDLFTHRSLCKRSLGVVPQEVAFDPFFAPRDILKITSGFYGVRPDLKWIEELLERLELAEHADKNTRQLSGGMRRRLLVAQALVHRPKVVILDEPTAGVDVELRKRLWDFMRELNAADTTILLTTHYLEEAQELCNEVAIIDKGMVLTSQSMQSLLNTTGSSTLSLEYEQLPSNCRQLENLIPFTPRTNGCHLLLTLSKDVHGKSNFNDAYQAAIVSVGVPMMVSIEDEDLEDVFLRLTHKETV